MNIMIRRVKGLAWTPIVMRAMIGMHSGGLNVNLDKKDYHISREQFRKIALMMGFVEEK